MNVRRKRIGLAYDFLTLLLVLIIQFAAVAPAMALDNPGSQLEEVGVRPILGNKVDLSGEFTDSLGNRIVLSQVMKPGIPSVFVPVYFDCPRLCGLVISGLVDLVNAMTLKLGAEYQVFLVSFDPNESFHLAAEKKAFYSAKLSGEGAKDGEWYFLTGPEDSVSRLMQHLGFRYVKDGEEYAHSAAIILLTPEGEISQYFTGIEYPAWDVRLALVEASQGKIGTALDHALLFCFRFDQLKGKYTWATMNLLRVGAGLTIIALGVLIFRFYRKERALAARSAT